MLLFKDDVNDINKLLFEVQKVHSDARSDLFIPGGRKYNDDELLEIINDISRPIFVVKVNEKVVGYEFCIISIS